MKNIKYLSLLFIGLLVAACGDPELRFQQFNESEKGAFARNLGTSGTFLLQDPAGSSINGTVEFYDENQGADVASYSWTVEFRANGGGNGGMSIPAVALKTYTSDQFSVSPDGLPSLTFSLGMQEALTALGLDVTDVTGGDQFRMDATVTLSDGRSFGQGNTGGNLISQPPFLALVRWNANVVCSSDLGGVLNYSTTNMVLGQPSGAVPCSGPATITGSQTMTDNGGGVYHIPDLAWGSWEAGMCWVGQGNADGGANAMLDICNTFSYGDGPDQYGDTYTLSNLVVAGAVITFDWVNTWGDGGTTTVTRADGANWPPLVD
jgi:hypothetical protein